MQATDATWAPQSPDLSGDLTSYNATAPESEHPQHRGYRGSISHPLPYSPPASSPAQPHKLNPSLTFPPTYPSASYPQPAFMPRGAHARDTMQDADYFPDSSDKSRGKRKEGNGSAATLPPGAENVNITVHFPVARIKRIMQADDDVGKVAQVTPVVVSKALELFMISLVTKAAAEAKARNSKRVGAIHLKHAVTKDEQFDFLNEIVSKVADAPAADKNDGENMDADGKKRKTAGRRKKKAESSSP
ncbi:histone-fold-containing protein [Periconia macrospinosa]|uniref:NCT transcriptional regulatory complex subunit A n=1 Tax=Periconia macrospinosa TaxID=97972 RepID=A0A2V1E1Z1_9PLEO|nr:histone-fold-containing protein [Periconia macrospinosa]